MNDDGKPVSVKRSGVTAFDAINSLCDKFRRRWKRGEGPVLEHYVARVRTGARPTLLRNLLPVDIEFRRRRGETPNSGEYIRRFPQHARLIRQSFFESTLASSVGEAELSHVSETMSVLSAVRRLGDYDLVRELGRGGMGIVYEGRHVRRHDQVALKTLPIDASRTATSDDQDVPADDATEQHRKQRVGDRLLRFKREFRTLADINHPNLVGLHGLETDGDQWFFTMDLVDGDDFILYVRPDDELDESRLRGVLPQLVAGIMALHRHHVVHRDLKPSNVLVTPQGQVRILDFGLAAELEEHAATPTAGGFAGTPAYSAPEQLFAQVGSPSDWYSLGVMLYEALAGKRPFDGNAVDLMQLKQKEDPPTLVGDERIPADLARLAMGLLARRPEDRPDALEITAAVSGRVETQTVIDSPGTGALVGRESQMSMLTHALESLRKQMKPLCVFVSGRSGEGKTSLAEHFLEPLRRGRQVMVLSGRCYDRESVPFKALDAIIDNLCSHLQRMPAADAAVLLPDDIGFLAHLFPVLQRVPVVTESSRGGIAALDRSQVRQRAFNALRSLLQRISRRTPIVMLADDLQWGDADSAEAILHAIGGNEPPALMFIGTYRSDEADDSRFLHAWDDLQVRHRIDLPLHSVKLAPLSVEECTQLVIDRLGRDDELVRRRAADFADKTGGNPFLLIELIGCFDPETDSFEALKLPEVIQRKLSRLPDEAESLLAVVAVAGKAIHLNEALQAAGFSSPVTSMINHMRSENLIRSLGHDDAPLVDTYHDKIRETLLSELPADRKRQLHLAIGRIIERSLGIDADEVVQVVEADAPTEPGGALSRAGDLAFHFAAADQSDRALAYSLLAAEEAKLQFALEVAATRYELAHRLAKEANRSTRFRIALGYGEILVLSGRFDKAIDILEQALAMADDDLSIAKVESLLAEVTYKSKSLPESIAAYERGLRSVGIKVARSDFGFMVALLWEAFTQLRHTWSPEFLKRKKVVPDEKTLIQLNLLYRIVYPYVFRSPVRTLWAGLASLNRAENVEIDSPESARQVAYAKASAGTPLGFLAGWYSLGARHLADLIETSKELDDDFLRAVGLRHVGYIQLSDGRFGEAETSFAEAEDLFETRVPDYWQLVMTRYWAACNDFRLGNFTKSRRSARALFETALEFGQDRLAQSILETWTRTSGGDLPFAELKSCIDLQPEDYLSTIQLSTAEAHWHLFHGRTAEAIEFATQAVALMKRTWLVHWHATSAITTLSRALREHAASIESSDPAGAKRCRKRSRRVARWALRIARRIRIEMPVALREVALGHLEVGKTKQALDFARKSCEAAEAHGAKYELALSQQLAARIERSLGITGADERLQSAEATLLELKPTRERMSPQDLVTERRA